MSLSLSTDNAWPAGLLKIFDICRRQQLPANRYYGPYSTLLNDCFGRTSFEYYVSLEKPPGLPSPGDSVNFMVVFDVYRRPVLIAEIKDDSWANSAILRHKADAQMRQHFDVMFADCPIPRRWGLSLLGTSLRVYCANVKSGDIEPKPENFDHIVPTDYLEESWNMDILSPEGFAKMQEIVADISASVAAL